jgi:hypothetical protein
VSRLTKQQIIMHRTAYGNDGAVFHEDLDEPGWARSFRLPEPDFRDMDWPEVITVTIEPGDLLNEAV